MQEKATLEQRLHLASVEIAKGLSLRRAAYMSYHLIALIACNHWIPISSHLSKRSGIWRRKIGFAQIQGAK